jgi:26S proteasome non-ATPase regulatory subunit 10
MRAARQGHRALVELLLARGADVAARSNDGETALTWARKQGREEVARLLEEAAAKAAGPPSSRGPS